MNLQAHGSLLGRLDLPTNLSARVFFGVDVHVGTLPGVFFGEVLKRHAFQRADEVVCGEGPLGEQIEQTVEIGPGERWEDGYLRPTE